MALAARWCRLALPEHAATSLTFALTNVCNLASLRHLCTPLNAIYLTDMFLQIRLTQSVTTFVISKLIKLFVRKYLFNCLSWLFYQKNKNWILRRKFRPLEKIPTMSSWTVKYCGWQLFVKLLSTTHADRWEKLFVWFCHAPSLWVFYWWHFKPENWDQWMSRDTDYWQRILSNYPHCGSMSQVSSINQTTSDPSSHTAAAARPSFMNLFKSCSHSWQSFREARHAITLSITPPPYFRRSV